VPIIGHSLLILEVAEYSLQRLDVYVNQAEPVGTPDVPRRATGL
jgi:hypothetical protein